MQNNQIENKSNKMKFQALFYVVSGVVTLSAQQVIAVDSSIKEENREIIQQEVNNLIQEGAIRWNETTGKFEVVGSIANALRKLEFISEGETSSLVICEGTGSSCDTPKP